MAQSRTGKVLALSFGQTLSALSILILGMVATRYLSVNDFATFRQTFLVYEFSMPILTLGLPSVLFYYLPKSAINKRSLVWETVISLMFLGACMGLFLLLGGNVLLARLFENPDLKETLLWLSPFAVFSFPALVLSSVLVYQGRTVMLALYNSASVVVPTAAIILFIIYTNSYEFPVLIKIVSSVFLFPIAIYFAIRSIKEKMKGVRIKRMLEVAKFSVPLGMATLFDTVSQQLDKVIVAILSGPEAYAFYVIGAVEIPLIGIITGSIRTVILGDMCEEYEKGNKQGAIDIFRKASIKSASILLPAMVFFLITAKHFIVTMFSETYKESIAVFMIYLLLLPARIVFYGTAFIAMGQTKKVMYRGAISLAMNAVLSIVFVKLFGIIGAALTSIAVIYFFTIPYNLVAIGKGFGVKPLFIIPFKKIGFILLLAVLSATGPAVMVYFFESLSSLVILIVSFVSYIAVLLPLLIYYKLLYIPEKITNTVSIFFNKRK